MTYNAQYNSLTNEYYFEVSDLTQANYVSFYIKATHQSSGTTFTSNFLFTLTYDGLGETIEEEPTYIYPSSVPEENVTIYIGENDTLSLELFNSSESVTSINVVPVIGGTELDFVGEDEIT